MQFYEWHPIVGLLVGHGSVSIREEVGKHRGTQREEELVYAEQLVFRRTFVSFGSRLCGEDYIATGEVKLGMAFENSVGVYLKKVANIGSEKG